MPLIFTHLHDPIWFGGTLYGVRQAREAKPFRTIKWSSLSTTVCRQSSNARTHFHRHCRRRRRRSAQCRNLGRHYPTGYRLYHRLYHRLALVPSEPCRHHSRTSTCPTIRHSYATARHRSFATARHRLAAPPTPAQQPPFPDLLSVGIRSTQKTLFSRVSDEFYTKPFLTNLQTSDHFAVKK